MANEIPWQDKVYTIKGESYAEIEDRLYQQYGVNFTILNHKPGFKKGFLGFFQKQYCVVRYQLKNAAVPVAEKKAPSVSATPVYPQTNLSNRISPSGAVDNSADAFLRNRDSILNKVNPNVTSNIQLGALTKQMEEFEKKISQQMDRVVKVTSAEEEHKSITRIREILEDNEFTRSYIRKILERIRRDLTITELDDFDFVQEKVMDWIGESILISKDKMVAPPNVIILVGPTGVGKTTTLAKMGASVKINYRDHKEKYKFPPRIRMISTDSMRVGALQQLQRWAELIDVNVDKAEYAEDLETLCRGYADNSDYIFIDTSGYSPNDFKNIAKMRETLSVKNMNENIYLAVSAGVSAKDLENIIRNYECFNFKSVIVTKCDETLVYGRIISVLSEKEKALSWLTVGQDVMGTLKKASPVYFLERLKGFKFNKEHVEKKFGNADKEAMDFKY